MVEEMCRHEIREILGDPVVQKVRRSKVVGYRVKDDVVIPVRRQVTQKVRKFPMQCVECGTGMWEGE